jgi:hypothetical protein
VVLLGVSRASDKYSAKRAEKSLKPMRVLFLAFVKFVDNVAAINTVYIAFAPGCRVEV